MRVRIGAFFASLPFWAWAAAPPAQAASSNIFNEAQDVIYDGFRLLFPDEFRAEDLEVKIGVGVGSTTSYTGDDDYERRVVPLIDINYRDRIHLSGSGLMIRLWRTENFRTGFFANYRGGRKESDSPDLRGLGDVGNSVELGGYFEWHPDNMRMHVEFGRDVVSGHGGIIATGTLDHGLWRSNDKRAVLVAGVGTEWASKSYSQKNFGITSEQSAASGLPVFMTGSGIRNVSARLLGRYSLSENWHIVGLVRYTRLTGAAANSPLVRERGAADQWLAGLGAYYSF